MGSILPLAGFHLIEQRYGSSVDSMAVMRAFFDDSGNTEYRSEWYVLAGYIATVEQWVKFERQWLCNLAVDPPLSRFKGSDVYKNGRNDIWPNMTTDQKAARLAAFRRIVTTNTSYAFAIAVRHADFNETMRDNMVSKWESPYHWLFASLLHMVDQTMLYSLNPNRLSIVFDEDLKHEDNAIDMLRLWARAVNQNLRYRIAGLRFDTDDACIPLQGADWLAWHVRRALCAPGVSVSEDLRRLAAMHPCPFFLFQFDREMLEVSAQIVVEKARENGIKLITTNVGTLRKPKLIKVPTRANS